MRCFQFVRRLVNLTISRRYLDDRFYWRKKNNKTGITWAGTRAHSALARNRWILVCVIINIFIWHNTHHKHRNRMCHSRWRPNEEPNSRCCFVVVVGWFSSYVWLRIAKIKESHRNVRKVPDQRCARLCWRMLFDVRIGTARTAEAVRRCCRRRHRKSFAGYSRVWCEPLGWRSIGQKHSNANHSTTLTIIWYTLHTKIQTAAHNADKNTSIAGNITQIHGLVLFDLVI